MKIRSGAERRGRRVRAGQTWRHSRQPLAFDLYPPGTEVGLGLLQWRHVPEARRLAVRYGAAPAGGREAGEGLPLVILEPPPGAAAKVAGRIGAAIPIGVTHVAGSSGVMVSVVGEKEALALQVLVRPHELAALRTFEERRAETSGLHGIAVVNAGRPGGLEALFELRLWQAPPA